MSTSQRVCSFPVYVFAALYLLATTTSTAQTCNDGGFAFIAPPDSATLTGQVWVTGTVRNACPIKVISLFYDCWNDAGPSWRLIGTQQPNNASGQDVTLTFPWDSSGAPLGRAHCQLKSLVTYNSGKSVDNYIGFHPSGPPPLPSLIVETKVLNYTGSTDLTCNDGYALILASCNTGFNVVLTDKNTTLPVGANAWASYLIPSSAAATGVHCDLGSPNLKSQVQLRCYKVSR